VLSGNTEEELEDEDREVQRRVIRKLLLGPAKKRKATASVTVRAE